MNYPTGELEWSYQADMAVPGSEATATAVGAAGEVRPGDLPGTDTTVQNSGGVVTPERINPAYQSAEPMADEIPAPVGFREVPFTETRERGIPVIYRRATVNAIPGAPAPYHPSALYPPADADRATIEAGREQFKRIQSLPERIRHKLFFRRAKLNRAATKTPYRFKPKFRKLLLRRMANARAFLTEHAQQELAGRSMDRIDGQEMVALGYDPGRICGVACGFYNNAGRMFKPL